MAGLELQHIHVAYGARTVLTDVSLHVPPGTLTVLVGPNGAGKTTLLRAASGWTLPTKGSVLVDGRPYPGPDRRAAAQAVAVVGDDDETGFPYSVHESVAFGRFAWRGPFGAETDEDRAAVARAIERTALEPLVNRTVSTLSAGERQRVRLARCLAQDAPVLLFDEPTAHLDWHHAHRAATLLRDVAHGSGKAVLAVLHDLNMAARVADRIVLLHNGRKAAEGAPADVLTPAQIAAVFAVHVDVLTAPGGGPVLVPSPDVVPDTAQANEER